MPAVPPSQRAPASAMLNQGPDYQTPIDWDQVENMLAAIENHVDCVRTTEGMSYSDMLCKARVYRTSERPEYLQTLLDDDEMMIEILTTLRQATDANNNARADPLTRMQWQARYLLARFKTTDIRCDPIQSLMTLDLTLRLTVTSMIALMHWCAG